MRPWSEFMSLAVASVAINDSEADFILRADFGVGSSGFAEYARASILLSDGDQARMHPDAVLSLLEWLDFEVPRLGIYCDTTRRLAMRCRMSLQLCFQHPWFHGRAVSGETTERIPAWSDGFFLRPQRPMRQGPSPEFRPAILFPIVHQGAVTKYTTFRTEGVIWPMN